MTPAYSCPGAKPKPGETVRVNRRILLASVIACATLVGAGLFAFEKYTDSRQQEVAVQGCSACDARKASQVRQRNSRLEQGSTDAANEQQSAQ